jgi:hypothetical protein
VLSFAADDESAFDLCLLSADFAKIEMLVAPGESHELDAAIVAPRPPPPILVDDFVTESAPLPPTEDPNTFFLNDTFRFDCLNVFTNAAVDAPIPDAPKIAADSRIRFFLNFQRKNSLGRDPAILYREARLTPQGAVHEHDIPAEVPMFEQLIDADGKVITTPAGKAAHVTGMNFARQGEGTKCVGCHAGHSVIAVPKNGADAEWFNVATSATVTASSEWKSGNPGTPASTNESSAAESAGRPNATAPAGATSLASAAGVPGPSAARVVDRRARSDSIGVAWIAAGDRDESVLLEWELPVEVTSLVLYGVHPNPAAGTDLRLENCRIELLRDDIVIESVSKTGRIAPEGTTITVPKTVIDAARVTVTKSKGRVLHQQVTGLAEIEVIARIADRQVATQNP